MTRNAAWTIEFVVRATGGRLVAAPPGYADLTFDRVSTDSRTIGEGELFVALDGPNFDAADFLADAVEKGAAAVIVAGDVAVHDVLAKRAAFVAVPDTLAALGDLAHAHRELFAAPVVAITGSTGKTTTKDMLGAILTRHFGEDVLITEGNFNNLIGMPLTLLRLRAHHRAAVLELGMSMRGEMRRLARIARPDIGVVTNVAEAHMERLPNIEAVAAAKRELVEDLDEKRAAVLNADDPRVAAMASGARFRVVTFGVDNPADVRGEDIRVAGADGIRFTLAMDDARTPVTMSVIGRHNVHNALAAAAASRELGVPAETIALGLEAFRPAAMRLRVLNILNVRVLDDTYNASPRSMDAALSTLAELAGGGRKIVVVGDMKELGAESEAAHRRLGRHVAKIGADRLFAIGEYAHFVAEGAIEENMDAGRIVRAENHQAIVEALRDLAAAGDTVLVKGSRAMRMECVVKGLKGEMF
ncbi:UDP-N-acetylmuramoyl-tripeptide--D-alanyl-D-alanine ligase [bacterium]|nr:UDP-N-acetylmuramoyl-tripeptide--D-alanyl-D-alanine ligase [bacterium]